MGVTIDLASIAASTPDSKVIGSDDPQPSLEGVTVLLVEDQALIAMELQTELEMAGATVIGPIGRLADAVAAARAGGFAVAILDIDLVGEDVFPAADILVERGVPFVFHTGHGSKADLAESYEAPVCIKPLPGKAIVRVLSGLS